MVRQVVSPDMQIAMRRRSSSGAIALIFALAFATRFVLALAFPAEGGDWPTYATIADNILRGCGVSLSVPADGDCRPHFGGNHLPGYPLFVAAIWRVSGASEAMIRVVQCLLCALAIARLAAAVRAFSGSGGAALAAGIVLALSPLTIGWPRYLVTEGISIAVAIWLLAECVASLTDRRLRWISLSLAVIAGGWLRWDGFLLAVPVALTAFMVERPARAVARCAGVGALVALTLAGWTWRNHRAGLPLAPPIAVIEKSNAPSPYGYVAWGATWATTEYQRVAWLWPLTFMRYSGVRVDSSAWDSPEEQARVVKLLDDLKSWDGRPFPPALDAQFSDLARERAARAPLRTYVQLPAERALALWSNPFSSFGLPSEIPADFSRGQVNVQSGWVEIARAYPGQTITKMLTTFYRIVTMAGFAAALVLSFCGAPKPSREIMLLTTGWIVARTLFFALTDNIETRFLAPMIPALELATVFVLFGWVHKVARRSLKLFR